MRCEVDCERDAAHEGASRGAAARPGVPREPLAHAAWHAAPQRAVELAAAAYETFVVPDCRACGAGPLKPRVVFFGDSVEPATHRAAKAASDGADAVLVVGSSVSTFSAFRLVRDAARRNVPVAILTKGETRADALASVKVERLAGQTLPLVMERALEMEKYGY